MDAQVRETLTGGGIDVDGMLERCMGSEAIMGRLLKKFPTDATYARLEEAFASGDAVQVKFIIEKLGCSLKEVNACIDELKNILIAQYLIILIHQPLHLVN